MALTIGNMANIETGSSLVKGQSQANSMGLGESSGNALALTNLMEKDDGQGLIGNLLKPATTEANTIGGNKKGALSRSHSRLRGQGLKNDLMNIGGALTANALGSGMSTGLKGSLLDDVV